MVDSMAPSRRLLVAIGIAAVAVLGIAGGVALTSQAQAGRVTINGVLISPHDALVLGLPNGDYWYDPSTGAYGLIGGPLIGYAGGGNGGQAGYNFETPFGGGMSDGNCAFILEVAVGNC
jgi:hypothetical protein